MVTIIHDNYEWYQQWVDFSLESMLGRYSLVHPGATSYHT